MAQITDWPIPTGPSGLAMRQQVNLITEALRTSNSGATAPTPTVAGMLWFDTSVSPGLLKQRNNANDAWVALAAADDSITNAKLANMATARLKGRVAAGTGDPEDLTVTQVQSLLGLSELTQAQAEDDASTVFGQVSGQRLAQAIAAIPDWTELAVVTAASTSAIDVLSLPAEISEIEILLWKMCSGSRIQIGTGASFTTTGYRSSGGNNGSLNTVNQTNGFVLFGDAASSLLRIVRVDGNNWLASYAGGGGAFTSHGGGDVTLGGELNRVRLVNAVVGGKFKMRYK